MNKTYNKIARQPTIRIYLSLLFLASLTSCLYPSRLSKLPKDIHFVKKREANKEYKIGSETLTVQYLGAHTIEKEKEQR